MADRITSKETRAWLEDYFGHRRDVGLWNAVWNLVVLPPSPFKTEADRQLRTEFLFAAGLLACASGWFFYFSFRVVNVLQ
ncbi:MAG TPA: hypothetical protein VND65_00625 [Candidatus Binatia bacterium]|nr:hypothetical protein [Candidatus Binatia bacterium]